MRPSLTEELASSPATVGTFFHSCSPQMAEAIGYTPLEFLLIDQQHGSATLETIEEIARAAELNGVPVLVRLPGTSADPVNTVLDTGAVGIVIPQVEDGETIERVTSKARYDENRSLATSTRASQFGTLSVDEYMEYVHEKVAIVPQIETEAGLASVEEIAAFDSVTALLIGPQDLSVSLGVSKESEEFAAAVDRIVDAANEAECGVGMWVSSRNEIETYEERMTYLIYKSDIGIVTTHLSELLSEE